MKVIILLWHYIMINLIFLISTLYFLNLYIASNNIKNNFKIEIESLNTNINNNNSEIKKLNELRGKLQKYLKSAEYRPPIYNFKESLLLEKKLLEFIELNESNIVFSIKESKNIDDSKMYFPIEIKTTYSNIKEIEKFLEYLTNLNKTKIKSIHYDGKSKDLLIHAEILSEKF